MRFIDWLVSPYTRRVRTKHVSYHAHQRCWSRHGFRLHGPTVLEQIHTQKALLLRKESNNIRIYLIKQKKKQVALVWSKKHKLVITVLPENCHEHREFTAKLDK